MPDVAVVLGNGAVGGEHARFGNVHQTLAPPAFRVAGVIAEGLPLAHNVGVEVRQGLEPVFISKRIRPSMTISTSSGMRLPMPS